MGKDKKKMAEQTTRISGKRQFQAEGTESRKPPNREHPTFIQATARRPVLLEQSERESSKTEETGAGSRCAIVGALFSRGVS